MVIFQEDEQNKKLAESRNEEEESLARLLGERYGLKYLDLTLVPVNLDALRLIPEADAKRGLIVAFNLIAQRLDVGVMSPNNPATEQIVAGLVEQGYTVTQYIISQGSLDRVMQRYADLSYSLNVKAGALDIASDEIQHVIDTVRTTDDVKKLISDLITQTHSKKISKILEIMVAGGLATGASDIHMEPEEHMVRIRYRLDGVLQDVTELEQPTYAYLLSRIKLLSGLKLNLHGTQDGRFSIEVKNSEIEIRTSILPGAYNEAIVMRILNPDSISVPLESLGIEPRLLELIMKQLAKPNGMVLTTGPTGSGKTTALYAFLRKIHSPGVKIITIENPIEYHLPGIVQTQTDPEKNYTFLGGLRAALRQDPDVIMVGEIRDDETAEIAINSALTGHLVFSTLHTNNAAGTFPRLIDLGVNPKILTSAINISMAQRLTRKLCPHCKKEQALNDTDKTLINRVLADMAHKEDIPQMEKMWMPVGCDKCNNSGYKGRIGIFEAILADKKIEEALQGNPSEREVAAAAKSQGINTMQQDGILKVLRGVISLEELERVVDLEDK